MQEMFYNALSYLEALFFAFDVLCFEDLHQCVCNFGEHYDVRIDTSVEEFEFWRDFLIGVPDDLPF
jgi:hypothetical protein